MEMMYLVYEILELFVVVTIVYSITLLIFGTL